MYQKALPIYNIEKFNYPAKEKYFYACEASKHIKKFNFIREFHIHDHYVTILCTQGSGVHEVNFKPYEVKPGSIFLLSPGQAHGWKFSEDADGYVVLHDKDFYNLNYNSKKIQDYPFFCSNLNSPEILLKNNEFDKVRLIFADIIEENKQQYLLKNQRICSLLDILYIYLTRLYIPKKQIGLENQAYLIKLRTLEELIDEHFRDKKDASYYANEMHVSLKHLNRICKLTLNKTTSDLISERLMLEAKRLLASGHYSVEEVASAVGYFDQSYFSRVFKSKSGFSPLDFIKKYRGHS